MKNEITQIIKDLNKNTIKIIYKNDKKEKAIRILEINLYLIIKIIVKYYIIIKY